MLILLFEHVTALIQVISLLIQTRFAVKKFLNLYSFKKIFLFFDGGILQCTDVGLSMSPLIDHSLA